MELALRLGEQPSNSKPFPFLEKTPKLSRSKDLGFCMGDGDGKRVPSDPPLQLRFPCFTHNDGDGRGLDVNRLPPAVAEESEEGAAVSSPNSAVSSFQMDFGIRNGSNRRKRDLKGVEAERASDEDDDELNGSTRKKLRLSKQQSAFLEESFKEHNTLNPKQKLALAKQLNLRPRQVEVWFQNRRARTKLKQTEVDCEYLKRCCEKLTEENKRLQKELQELRALKNSQPFFMHSPATTLTMCSSCERVAVTKAATAGCQH
ncbi:homeobox from Arabidopsis thaliana [Hibiscus trionum]|uniref:Homeobox from Arabidopsis thaliana n=1 Tax=Hibiscus trionum TaxID=183268 RepID=A0A9W7HUX1_HIBTR|nr:homeobox from Arabidopsis thaliana [Hibiscus trionum]